jgi:hypothetical protein
MQSGHHSGPLEGAAQPPLDDQTRPSFYANLARARGDLNAVIGNLAHESYHVMQKAAQRRAGLGATADSTGALLEAERLLAVTLSEGVANSAVALAS